MCPGCHRSLKYAITHEVLNLYERVVKICLNCSDRKVEIVILFSTLHYVNPERFFFFLFGKRGGVLMMSKHYRFLCLSLAELGSLNINRQCKIFARALGHQSVFLLIRRALSVLCCFRLAVVGLPLCNTI